MLAYKIYVVLCPSWLTQQLQLLTINCILQNLSLKAFDIFNIYQNNVTTDSGRCQLPCLCCCSLLTDDSVVIVMELRIRRQLRENQAKVEI